MSWTEVDLTSISTEMESLPVGTYVFSLLPGAKYSQWDKNKIELGAKIVEGEYTGRVQYFSYGDPDKTPSMLGAFKRLEIALAKNTGVKIEEGEDPINYLNNPEVVGGKFVSDLRSREIPATEEKPARTVTDLSIFKVKPLAV